MTLGQSLALARKKKGISQEQAGEKLGVSRQTISNWELDLSMPDIRQAKAMAAFYGVSLDSLLSFDVRLEEIKNAISQSDGNFQKSLDWTALWAEKYPVLASYKGTVDIERYQKALSELLSSLKSEYGYNDPDALLVLKDILGSAAKP